MAGVSGNDPAVPDQQPKPAMPDHPQKCLCTIKHPSGERIENPLCPVH